MFGQWMGDNKIVIEQETQKENKQEENTSCIFNLYVI